LRVLLEHVPSVAVVGAIDVESTLRHPPRSKTDVALLDARPPECLKIVQSLRRPRPRLRIVAIGVHEVESEVLACAAAGIDGYVPVGAGADDLRTVLDSVMRQEFVCSPKVAASLYNCVGLLRAVSAEPLTARELEVIDLMNDGLSNKEIARRLGIETSTVKNHVQNILLKLNVHRRGQAAAKLRALIREQLNRSDAISDSPVELICD
jgi:two-component system, NarL family, nitrate/nitrite response regulator NarL